MTRVGIAVAFMVTVLATFACDPIVGTPPEAIPFNACPEIACPSNSSCSEGRCQTQGALSYDYVLVINLPSTSFYAAGTTFVIPSRDLTGVDKVAQCPIGRTCFRLPQLATVETSYRITPNAATLLGVDQRAIASVPQVTFIPLSPGKLDTRFASNIGLPLDDVTTVEVKTDDPTTPPTAETVLTPGPYTRVATPSPEMLPPVITQDTLGSGVAQDAILVETSAECQLCPYPLDEKPNDSRLLSASRQGGLDGYRSWLVDGLTNLRISSTRALTGTSAVADLSTVKQDDSSGALRTLVNEVLAPPDGAVGVPIVLSQTTGFIADLTFPALPPPASVEGQVVDATNAGVLSTLVLDSDPGGAGSGLGIARVAPDAPSRILAYRTSVSTDRNGRFATVLPPGSYAVTVTPDPTSGKAMLSGVNVTISGDGSLAPFVVVTKSAVSGTVSLADGRPLAGADVRATPSVSQANNVTAFPRTSPWVFPRETHARTNPDGSFVLFADVGTYDLTFTPQPGTGFPRLVRSRALQVAPAANPQDVAVIQEPFHVPPPIALEYTVFDPTGSTVNAISGAIIRVFTSFAAPNQPGLLDYIEVGEGMTDANGNCEILVTPTPP